MTISLEDELPVARLPEDPRWRENFCFDGYDRRRDVGFWIHCGRWSLDPSIWREQVLVDWPGGDSFVIRSWGFRPSARGPSGALLDLVCEEPGRRWRLRYHGPTRRTTREELLRGVPLAEGPKRLMHLDIEFTSENPVWNMAHGTDMSSQAWARFHIEQNGRFRGTIAVDGETAHMDGFGWRDHSRGPRDVQDMGRHAWIHGDLPGGRSFAMTIYQARDGAGFRNRLDEVVVFDGGRIYPARCARPPLLESADPPPPGYEFTIEYELGRFEVQAEARRCLPHSTTRYMECFDGVCPGLAQVVTYEQGTVFRVDGGEYDGHTERSYFL